MQNVESEMKPIADIRKAMSKIHRAGGTVYTNYYNQCHDVVEKLRSWQTESTVIFEWVDEGIRRIYFYSVNIDELKALLKLPAPGSVIDYLTKDKQQLADVFRDSGYRLHLEYGRFCVRPHTPETEVIYDTLHADEELAQELFEAPYGEMARVEDAEEIDRQLRDQFDPLEAHFYSMDQLREHIKKGWVWVARENGKIVAANLFEVQGRKLYGAYLYNYADINVMCSLIAKTDAYILAHEDIAQFYCWMRLNNRRAIRYNMKYNGYVPDGLFDMIYEKE